MKNLIIIGAASFGREVYWHAQNSIGYNEKWRIKGILDGDIKLPQINYELMEAPLLGSIDNYQIKENDVFICAIADPEIKGKIVTNMMKKNAEFMNLIHKTALISPSAKIGVGNIFCPFTLVSVNVIIGSFIIFNYYSSIGHDAKIDDYSSIMGHVDIAGGVKICKYGYFGSGARALPKSIVGEYSKVGAGSVVMKEVKDRQVVFGNPARPLRIK